MQNRKSLDCFGTHSDGISTTLVKVEIIANATLKSAFVSNICLKGLNAASCWHDCTD